MVAMDLAPLLRAHGYLRVERPPELWEADVDDVLLVRALGEMIAAALVRGTELGDVLLRASNVTVEADDPTEGDDDKAAVPAAGDYVALSVVGRAGDWRPEMAWTPGGERGDASLLSADLETAVRAGGVPFAYTRSSGEGGSVTVFLRRADPRPASADQAGPPARTDEPKV